MQELVADDGGVIVLMLYNYLGANSKAVPHGTIAPHWHVDGMKIAKGSWFASPMLWQMPRPKTDS